MRYLCHSFAGVQFKFRQDLGRNDLLECQKLFETYILLFKSALDQHVEKVKKMISEKSGAGGVIPAAALDEELIVAQVKGETLEEGLGVYLKFVDFLLAVAGGDEEIVQQALGYTKYAHDI